MPTANLKPRGGGGWGVERGVGGGGCSAEINKLHRDGETETEIGQTLPADGSG